MHGNFASALPLRVIDQTYLYERAHSSMDRVQASGACGMGSTPIGPF